MKQELYGPTSHIYISQRLRLHYVDWGNRDAEPLLLIHGAQDHCRNWDWVAQALRDDWHIIAPDLRGHGDSAWSPDGHYTGDAYLADIAQLVEQKKLGPLTIIAHSMGGQIAVRFAATYPEYVKKLVVIEGIGLNPDTLKEMSERSYTESMREWVQYRRDLSGRMARRYPTLEEAYARMQAKNPHLSVAQAQHLAFHGISQNEDGSYSWKFDNYTRRFARKDFSEQELRWLYEQIECPTLILWGDDTFLENPADNGRIEHFRNARLLTYENAGHWLHHDQLERFLNDVGEFLAD